MTVTADRIVVRLGGRCVLDDVSVRIEAGRITGFIGPNGAGKSTLLRTLAGLLKADSGRVAFRGRAIADFGVAERAQMVAYLPQDRAVHWPLAARAIVALGRLPYGAGHGSESANDQRAIDAAMTATDTSHLASRPVDQLSGGERARVLFARALAQESRVILADEPTAGLDPAHAIALFSGLQGLATEGRAVAIALHDLGLAARFCHEIVILAEGRVAVAGPAAHVLRAETLAPVFGIEIVCGQVAGVPVIVPGATRRS